MTDKTSTAPVMSLREVRDLLEGAQTSGNLSRVSLHVTRVRQAIRSLDHHLNAPTPDVVGGDVVVEGYDVARHNAWLEANAAPGVQGDAVGPEWRVTVSAEKMAEIIENMTGPNGEALEGTLWLGIAEDCGWEHKPVYGVHLSCNECPEEGSITLAALAAQPKGDDIFAQVAANSPKEFQTKAHPAEQTRGDGVVVSAFDGGWWFDLPGQRLTIWDETHDPDASVATIVLRECARAMLNAPRQAVPDGWKPISELPTGLKQFHAYTSSGDQVIAYRNRFGVNYEGSLHDDLSGLTHYRMMVAAPTAGRMRVE